MYEGLPRARPYGDDLAEASPQVFRDAGFSIATVRHGTDGVVAKPFENAQLLASVRAELAPGPQSAAAGDPTVS